MDAREFDLEPITLSETKAQGAWVNEGPTQRHKSGRGDVFAIKSIEKAE